MMTTKPFGPTINQARRLQKDFDVKGIIVLSFNDLGQFVGVSAGRTKKDCRNIGKCLDQIVDALLNGKLEGPWQESNELTDAEQLVRSFK